MDGFRWMNESWMTEQDGKISIWATEKSDFFVNPGAVAEDGITPDSLGNAPFYYTEVAGDFVLRAQVSHDFADVYDSASLMVMESDRVWAKACFEQTDFGTHAAVSVVTNQVSDDANGCNLNGNTAWLQIARVGQMFGFHYSEDGAHFYMMRVFSLPVSQTVKVGLLAQAPTGAGGERRYESISLERRTVKNIRVGQ